MEKPIPPKAYQTANHVYIKKLEGVIDANLGDLVITGITNKPRSLN